MKRKATLFINVESDTDTWLMSDLYEPAGAEFRYYGITFRIEGIEDVFDEWGVVRKIYVRKAD